MFSIKKNFGRDTIKDFEKGNNILDFSQHEQVNEIADFIISGLGGGTLIMHGQDEITLPDVLVTTIDEADFWFI